MRPMSKISALRPPHSGSSEIYHKHFSDAGQTMLLCVPIILLLKKVYGLVYSVLCAQVWLRYFENTPQVPILNISILMDQSYKS